MMTKLYLNAGQMKAGTTFLQRLLAPNKNIKFTPEKEIHFLERKYGDRNLLTQEIRLKKVKQYMAHYLDPEIGINRTREFARWSSVFLEGNINHDWYLRLFDNEDDGAYCADFSNLTCNITEEGLKKIKEDFDLVKVTYCLRDPVDRVVSHLKFHLQFVSPDLRVHMLSDDQIQSYLTSENILPQIKSDLHIQNLNHVFDKDFGIIRCEEMWKDPLSAYQKVCNFLEVEPLINLDELPKGKINAGPPSDDNERVRKIALDCLGDEIAAALRSIEMYSDIFII